MATDDGDEVIVCTGGDHDRVEISVDPATGERVVIVNGAATRYGPSASLVVVRTGDGNDEVVVTPGVHLRVTVFGGAGDDILRGGDGDDILHGEGGADRIHGGAGNDRIWGGAGRDYIEAGPGDDTIRGGRANDTVYGLGGADAISGGGGNDFLEGGTGDDTLEGGRGNDVLSGGHGDDTMRGGQAHDRLYAGPGRDTVDGGAGVDVSYVQQRDRVAAVERAVLVELRPVGTFIRIEGSPAFVERVQADLDLLRSSPRGKALLTALAAGIRVSRSRLADTAVVRRFVSQGDTLTIREYVPPSREEDNSFAHSDVERRRGQQMLVEYQTDLDNLYDGPPITVLYHELAHIYDFLLGTTAEGVYIRSDNPGADNAERVAVGLPIDHDGDASTPHQRDPRHPYDYTENGLRDELGTPRAPRY